jgi:membrane-associated phospholipid phosphatase
VPARAKTALVGAAAGAVLLVLVWLAAFHLGLAKHADQSVLLGFTDLGRPRVSGFARAFAQVCDPVPFVCLGAVIVLAAFARGRSRVALATAALLAGANVTTQLLKPALAQPRPHALLGHLPTLSAASWPSGHATAAMSLALAAVLASPARWRPAVAAVGAVFAVAISYSMLTIDAHYPSDILGGFLVATTWTLLTVAALFTLDARRSREPSTGASRGPTLRAALTPAAAAIASAAVLVGLLALVRPHQVISYAGEHGAFIVGAAMIAALGLALATAVMLSVRR